MKSSLKAPVLPLTEQVWSSYTMEDHDTWRILYRRRMSELVETASRVFTDGCRRIGLAEDRIPRLDRVNEALGDLTGWQAVPVTGFVPARTFFEALATRQFPTTVTIRSRQNLEYVPEPDIFHDVFGHVPLHANGRFADFLCEFGKLASGAADEAALTRMTRLFWFTVEFGLVREEGAVKVYGSGLISSAADAANAFGPGCERKPFDPEAVFRQDFEIDHLQPVLFVIESYDQLLEAIADYS